VRGGYTIIDADGHVQEPADLWDRWLDPAFLADAPVRGDDGGERTYMGRDAGVCIHVLGPGRDGELVEYLRLDCFDDEPHYHYVYNDERAQDRVFLDPTLEGDPMEWALDRVRTRMPEVLVKVGAPELAAQVDQDAIEAAMPEVRRAIDRAHALGEARV